MRQEREAQTLANLTGWSLDDIRRGIPSPPQDNRPGAEPTKEQSWWDRLWGGR